jgi:hypothetical protein
MAEIIGETRSLKNLARNQSDAGNGETAATTLQHAIDLLEAALTERQRQLDNAEGGIVAGETPEKVFAAELADLYGMLGGVRRKQGDLVGSITAYDQGFKYEADPRYGIVNTYNALNRLVTRVLLKPGCLLDPEAFRGELEFVDVPRSLSELQRELKQEVDGARSNDFWAAGDLAFTCALKGDVQGAVEGFQRFKSCSPPPPAKAYRAYSDWMGEVARLDTPRKEALSNFKALFEREGRDPSQL